MSDLVLDPNEFEEDRFITNKPKKTTTTGDDGKPLDYFDFTFSYKYPTKNSDGEKIDKIAEFCYQNPEVTTTIGESMLTDIKDIKVNPNDKNFNKPDSKQKPSTYNKTRIWIQYDMANKEVFNFCRFGPSYIKKCTEEEDDNEGETVPEDTIYYEDETTVTLKKVPKGYKLVKKSFMERLSQKIKEGIWSYRSDIPELLKLKNISQFEPNFQDLVMREIVEGVPLDKDPSSRTFLIDSGVPGTYNRRETKFKYGVPQPDGTIKTAYYPWPCLKNIKMIHKPANRLEKYRYTGGVARGTLRCISSAIIDIEEYKGQDIDQTKEIAKISEDQRNVNIVDKINNLIKAYANTDPQAAPVVQKTQNEVDFLTNLAQNAKTEPVEKQELKQEDDYGVAAEPIKRPFPRKL